MAAAALGDTEGSAVVAVDVNKAGETPKRMHDPSPVCDTPPGAAEVVVCGPTVTGRTAEALVEPVEETARVGGMVESMVK